MRRTKFLWSLMIIVVLTAMETHANTREKHSLRYFAEYDKRPVESHNFKTVEGRELNILVCKPDGWKRSDTRAAMVWVHGGGWVSGGEKAFEAFTRYSATRGAVGFSITYRFMKSGSYRDNPKLSAEENNKACEAKRKEFIEGPSLNDLVGDCADAIRFIRSRAKEFGIDPQRISAIGDSAGAHLVASLGTIVSRDARVNVVIACSSISDLTYKFGRDYVKPSPGFGGKEMEEDPERLARAKAASPFFNISKTTPPFLVLAGKNDWLGDEPERFYKALKAKGVDCEMRTYPTAKHAFVIYGYSATLEEMTQALIDIDAFLLKRGLLDGPTSIRMPDYRGSKEVIIAVKETFKGPKTFKQERDFPAFITLSMKVKPADKFNGTLFNLVGKYGCKLQVKNGGYDFNAIKIRKRGKQFGLKSGEWQDVFVSLGKDKIIIRVGDRLTEIPNKAGQSFAANELIIGEKLNAEIRDLKVFGTTLSNEEWK